MRRLVALLVVTALAGCGHARTRRIAVSDDGRAAIVGGQAWRAPTGIVFFERDDVLHVVSLVPGATFSVAVRIGPDGGPVVPREPPFEVRDGVIVLRDRALPPTAMLVETGQLYPHDDHYHLTHRWQNEDWRALYRARGDDSPLPPGTRQVAAYALAVLLDHRIPGRSEDELAKGLRRMTETVARARRAVEGQLPAKQTMAMVLHDFEILDGGATLSVEGKELRAADGVRFSYCGDHFHVEDPGGAWGHPIRLMDADPGRFEMPPSMFFEVAGGVVMTRSGEAAWKDLVARRQVKLFGDRWLVTEDYALPAFVELGRVVRDPTAPAWLRDRARVSLLEFMKLPLDVDSDAAFRARLAAMDRAIEARWRELEPELRGRRPRRR